MLPKVRPRSQEKPCERGAKIGSKVEGEGFLQRQRVEQGRDIVMEIRAHFNDSDGVDQLACIRLRFDANSNAMLIQLSPNQLT